MLLNVKALNSFLRTTNKNYSGRPKTENKIAWQGQNKRKVTADSAEFKDKDTRRQLKVSQALKLFNKHLMRT